MSGLHFKKLHKGKSTSNSALPFKVYFIQTNTDNLETKNAILTRQCLLKKRFLFVRGTSAFLTVLYFSLV